jgi:hypothetical protein
LDASNATSDEVIFGNHDPRFDLREPAHSNPAAKLLRRNRSARNSVANESESVQRAEEVAQSRFSAISARAKALHTEGKTTECMQAVTEAKLLLGFK